MMPIQNYQQYGSVNDVHVQEDPPCPLGKGVWCPPYQGGLGGSSLIRTVLELSGIVLSLVDQQSQDIRGYLRLGDLFNLDY
jgi:hypothetical protein